MLRTCTACARDLPLDAYYRHPRGKHGRQPKCKECHKAYYAAHRADHPEQYRAYEQTRAFKPERIAARDSRPDKSSHTRWRRANPEKMAAHNAVARALRAGTLIKPSICDGCQREVKLQAHHDDYTKKLDVRWLCHPCHVIAHHGERTRWTQEGAP